MRYLPSSSPRGQCPECGKTQLALTNDGRIKSPHKCCRTAIRRNCPGYGAFAVGHPTKTGPHPPAAAE